MLVTDVVSKVRFYQTARLNIRNDKNLSPQGIKRASDNLEQSIGLFRGEAFGVLEREWRDIRSRAKRVEAERLEAERLAGERWDYQKLAFETGSVERRLAGFTSLQEVTAWLEKEVGSGNPEHARAVAEVAPAVLRKRFPGVDGGEHLARAIERRLAVMLNTPELEKVEQAERDGGRVLSQLMRDTEEVGSFFEPGGVLWHGNEFTKLLENVKVSVSRKVNPDDPMGVFERTTFEFTPEPVGA